MSCVVPPSPPSWIRKRAAIFGGFRSRHEQRPLDSVPGPKQAPLAKVKLEQSVEAREPPLAKDRFLAVSRPFARGGVRPLNDIHLPELVAAKQSSPGRLANS